MYPSMRDRVPTDMCPVKTQISLCIHKIWSVFAVCLNKPGIFDCCRVGLLNDSNSNNNKSFTYVIVKFCSDFCFPMTSLATGKTYVAISDCTNNINI